MHRLSLLNSENLKTNYKRILVLGGGISGLSIAYELCRYSECDVQVLEKAPHAGGWLSSEEVGGFFFERGPRTFKTSRCGPLLELISDLGLQDQIISADRSAQKRYLWIDGRLSAFPKPILNLSVLSALIKELWVAPRAGDESIWDFANRRFNRTVAERLFDPLVLGVYGGDLKELSIQSCFPFFKRLEEEHGSVLKGLLFGKKRKQPAPIQASLFSLKGGCQQLIDTLVQALGSLLHLDEEVLEIGANEVRTTRGTYSADLIISALPPQVMASLCKGEMAELFSSIPMKNLHLVHLGYTDVNPKWRGFGYLIPSSEKQKAMGAIFDSMVFPQHNRREGEVRLTYMIRDGGESNEEAAKIALDAAKRHLQVTQKPDFLEVRSALNAIPQYLVGHRQRVEKLRRLVTEERPSWCLIGNYLTGASVSDCVGQGLLQLGQMLGSVSEGQR